MKKKLFVLCLGVIALLCMAPAVSAVESSADWNVTFTADNKLVSDYTTSNLSRKVFEMLPGDSVDLTLHLRNDNAEPANWYMSNKVLESLENAGNAASGGAYEYELVYISSEGDREELYASDTVGGDLPSRRAASDRVGLETATEGLENDFFLETLQPGAQATVRLRVSLDGETQGNDYQNTLARLQINFSVDPTMNRTEIVPERRLTVVQTGDQNRLLPFIIAAGVSGVLLLIFALSGMKERKKRKKAAEKTLCLLVCGALLCAAPGAPAAEAATTYTIRLFAGVQGEVNPASYANSEGRQVSGDDSALVIRGVGYGERVTLDPQEIVNLPQDSKYYIKGIRKSGQDEISVPDFSVTGDQDYVVVYGISGDLIAYTVEYVDGEGNELAPSVTRHGNIGDRAVVACRYIDGYRPPAYNQGMILTDDASKNVIRFVYTPLDVNVITQTIIEETPGVTIANGGPTTVIEDQPTPLIPEYQDIDDNQTPLADWKLGELLKDFATPFMNLPMAARIALATGAVALGALLVVLITKKRKKKDA